MIFRAELLCCIASGSTCKHTLLANSEVFYFFGAFFRRNPLRHWCRVHVGEALKKIQIFSHLCCVIVFSHVQRADVNPAHTLLVYTSSTLRTDIWQFKQHNPSLITYWINCCECDIALHTALSETAHKPHHVLIVCERCVCVCVSHLVVTEGNSICIQPSPLTHTGTHWVHWATQRIVISGFYDLVNSRLGSSS